MPSGSPEPARLMASRRPPASWGGPAGPVLTIREDQPARIIHLARAQPGPGLNAALGAWGGRLPGSRQSAAGKSSAILAVGPSRWLLVEDGPGDPASAAALSACFAIVVDVSDAWIRLALSGPAAIDLLATGSALDLYPQLFPDGACALAPFAQVRCLLRRVGLDYHLFVPGSHAASLWEWLIEAAAEFGVEVSSETKKSADTKVA